MMIAARIWSRALAVRAEQRLKIASREGGGLAGAGAGLASDIAAGQDQRQCLGLNGVQRSKPASASPRLMRSSSSKVSNRISLNTVSASFDSVTEVFFP
jgi:hypothetical protein